MVLIEIGAVAWWEEAMGERALTDAVRYALLEKESHAKKIVQKQRPIGFMCIPLVELNSLIDGNNAVRPLVSCSSRPCQGFLEVLLVHRYKPPRWRLTSR